MSSIHHQELGTLRGERVNCSQNTVHLVVKKFSTVTSVQTALMWLSLVLSDASHFFQQQTVAGAVSPANLLSRVTVHDAGIYKVCRSTGIGLKNGESSTCPHTYSLMLLCATSWRCSFSLDDLHSLFFVVVWLEQTSDLHVAPHSALEQLLETTCQTKQNRRSIFEVAVE